MTEGLQKNNLITFVSDGSACFKFSNYSYNISKGECLIIPKGEFYKVSTMDFCEYYFFHFTNELIESNTSHFNSNIIINYSKPPLYTYMLPETNYIWDFSDLKMTYDIETLKIIKECEKIHFEMNSKNRLLLNLKLQEILLELADKHYNKPKPALISDILNLIHDKYTEKLSLSDISKHFHISESYISRLFKKNTGLTVMQYILYLKLDYSTSLLINSPMTISQISEYLNFYDEFYFSKQFKKTLQCEP